MELPLLDERRLLTLLLLLLVIEWKRSIDSDREMHWLDVLLKAVIVRWPSEETEWRSGMIWPRKKTSSAAHICGCVKTEPINELKSKSSSALIG